MLFKLLYRVWYRERLFPLLLAQGVSGLLSPNPYLLGTVSVRTTLVRNLRTVFTRSSLREDDAWQEPCDLSTREGTWRWSEFTITECTLSLYTPG